MKIYLSSLISEDLSTYEDQSIYTDLSMQIYLYTCIYLSTYLSTYLSIDLSFCLSLYPRVFIYFFQTSIKHNETMICFYIGKIHLDKCIHENINVHI